MSTMTDSMMETAPHPFAAPPVWQTDPARMRRIAIVKGSQQLLIEQSVSGALTVIKQSETYAEERLGDLITDCLIEKCSAVWLAPPHALDWMVQIRHLLMQARAPLSVHPLTTDRGQTLCGLVAQLHGRGVPMCVHVLDAGDAWGIAAVCRAMTPYDIGAGLFQAAQLLGMQLRFSPSYVGLQVLRQELARTHREIPPLSDWVRVLCMEHRPTYFHWSRPIGLVGSGGTAAGTMLHKYDRNSSFVASAGEVGIGDPVRTGQFVPGRPGLYHIRAWLTGGDLDGRPDRWTLPGYFHTGERAGQYPWGMVETWAWEPQIRLAEKQGATVHILEGWVWPKKADLFRPWRERIWAARGVAALGTTPAARLAKMLIKKCGVAAVGRLNQRAGHAVVTLDEAEGRGLRVLHHELDEQGDWTGMAAVLDELGRSDLVRPDWWGTIIAGANERQMSALYAHRDCEPVAGYVDAVYCLGAWPASDLVPQQLGKWKHEWSSELSAADVAEWNEIVLGARAPAGERDENHTGAAIKLLAAIARRGGAEAEDGEEEAE